MEEFFIFLIVGFCAQLIDASLGMAYGLSSTTFLLSLGLPPATASATTHIAECITTGFSAIAHHQFGNVDPHLFKSLFLPGIVGGIIGATLLMHIDGDTIKPLIGLYLLIMGAIIIVKAFMEFPPRKVTRHLLPLGFFGGLLDATGGGGWGPIVTSTLLVRGNSVRTTIGSVNASEFFVAMTTSLTFWLGGTLIQWEAVLALAIGGAIASPLGAWICKYIPFRWLLLFVGILIIFLSSRMIYMQIFS